MWRKARKYGATVEAELGLVGGSEDGSCDHGIRCTDPDDAVVYARETGIDALAVAIGNAHGNYPVARRLLLMYWRRSMRKWIFRWFFMAAVVSLIKISRGRSLLAP
mgnify:FL=1